jgi:hypothetical protein
MYTFWMYFLAATGAWSIGLGMLLTTQNFGSFVLFRFIPVILGVGTLLFAVLSLMGVI